MATPLIQSKNGNRKVRKSGLFFRIPAGIFLFLWLATVAVQAQEFATDRLFIKEFSKTQCQAAIEAEIKRQKKVRDPTAEQERYLNANIWNNLRVELPLSPGQKRRLKKLKEGKSRVFAPRLSSKELWAQKAAKFKALRLQCK